MSILRGDVKGGVERFILEVEFENWQRSVESQFLVKCTKVKIPKFPVSFLLEERLPSIFVKEAYVMFAEVFDFSWL